MDGESSGLLGSTSKRAKVKKYSILIMGALTLIYSLVEIGVAIYSHSLTLAGDGFHNFSDVISLLIAYYANEVGGRVPTSKMTYGWRRSQILGGFTNSIFLLSLSVYIFLEAIPELISPPEIDDGIPFIVIAAVGVVLNASGMVVFYITGNTHAHLHSPSSSHSHADHGHSHEGGGHDHSHSHGGKKDSNVFALFLHFVGDAISSTIVLITGIIIYVSDAKWVQRADPISALIIVAIIIFTNFKLVKELYELMLQQAPIFLDVDALRLDIGKLEDITSVHDLHAWQLNENLTIASVHVVCKAEADTQKIRKAVRDVCHKHELHSTTVQVESSKDSVPEPYCNEHCAKGCHEEWCCDKIKKQYRRSNRSSKKQKKEQTTELDGLDV